MPRPPDVGVGVAAILLDVENRVLLGRRRGAHAAGRWSLPGGWIDRPDAETEQTVVREAAEEAGITVLRCTKYTWTTEDHPDLGCRTVTLYHLVQSGNWMGKATTMEPQKCDGWRWFGLDALPDPLFPGMRAVLDGLRGEIAGGPDPYATWLLGCEAEDAIEKRAGYDVGFDLLREKRISEATRVFKAADTYCIARGWRLPVQVRWSSEVNRVAMLERLRAIEWCACTTKRTISGSRCDACGLPLRPSAT